MHDVSFEASVLYGAADDLATRIAFYRSRFETDFTYAEALDAIASKARTVLEAGCGTMRPLLPIGWNYCRVQTLVGLDVAAPLLEAATREAPKAYLLRADVQVLPLIADAFDLIWARHSLYHVADPHRAILECRRCLAPTGVFCASTNSRSNKPQMHVLHNLVLEDLRLSERRTSPLSKRFSAEDGHVVVKEAGFAFVLSLKYHGYFKFQSPEEFVQYYMSTAYCKDLTRAGIDASEIRAIALTHAKTIPLRLDNDGAIIVASDAPNALEPFRSGAA